jgi:hypothetical protein
VRLILYLPVRTNVWSISYHLLIGVLSQKFHIYSSICPVTPSAVNVMGIVTTPGDMLVVNAIFFGVSLRTIYLLMVTCSLLLSMIVSDIFFCPGVRYSYTCTASHSVFGLSSPKSKINFCIVPFLLRELDASNVTFAGV